VQQISSETSENQMKLFIAMRYQGVRGQPDTFRREAATGTNRSGDSLRRGLDLFAVDDQRAVVNYGIICQNMPSYG
jgi:hypothetical protein